MKFNLKLFVFISILSLLIKVEHADGLAAPQHFEGLAVVERDGRQIDLEEMTRRVERGSVHHREVETRPGAYGPRAFRPHGRSGLHRR